MLTVQHGEEKRVRSGTMERSSLVKKLIIRVSIQLLRSFDLQECLVKSSKAILFCVEDFNVCLHGSRMFANEYREKGLLRLGRQRYCNL